MTISSPEETLIASEEFWDSGFDISATPLSGKRRGSSTLSLGKHNHALTLADRPMTRIPVREPLTFPDKQTTQ
jgi:hypothetical protein